VRPPATGLAGNVGIGNISLKKDTVVDNESMVPIEELSDMTGVVDAKIVVDVLVEVVVSLIGFKVVVEVVAVLGDVA